MLIKLMIIILINVIMLVNIIWYFDNLNLRSIYD